MSPSRCARTVRRAATRVPVRQAVLTGLALLLAAGCGGGPQTSTGRISDVEGRLCLQTNPEDGTCYTATDDQLAPLQVGSCVQVTYRSEPDVVPAADEVRVVDPPCFTGAR